MIGSYPLALAEGPQGVPSNRQGCHPKAMQKDTSPSWPRNTDDHQEPATQRFSVDRWCVGLARLGESLVLRLEAVIAVSGLHWG
jgi:hypothetical protein